MDEQQIRAQCTRWLSHHGRRHPSEVLAELSRAADGTDDPTDFYGEGGAVARLEARVGSELGLPSALFFIKGVTAQLSVLRMHAQRRQSGVVVVHPQSHIASDEADALVRSAGLLPLHVGRHRPFCARDLDGIREPVAAVVVELPLRRPGYLLPPLDQLRAISAWCRERDAALHLDGARLWEAAAGYGVAPAELAALADTVYASFYKGLGGLGGAAVAGGPDLVAALRPWKTRYGGDLVTAYPQALSALAGFQAHLPRMPDYTARARGLADRLSRIPGVLLNPRTPHANSFQIHFEVPADALAARQLEFARSEQVWLFGRFAESPIEGRCLGEVTIGSAADAWTDDEAVAWIQRLVS